MVWFQEIDLTRSNNRQLQNEAAVYPFNTVQKPDKDPSS
jgi:hypothetical protein